MSFGMENLDLIMGVALLVYSISLHELGHAWSSNHFGDPTPARHGRLTFNPLVQLHWLYTGVIPLVTYILNGWPMGWAYCPVDPTRYRKPLRDNALVCLAGPAVNFAIVLVCVGVLWLMSMASSVEDNISRSVFFGVGAWNLLLGVFNLLPFPGMDGYGLLRVFLPIQTRNQLDAFRQMGHLSFFLAIFLGGAILSYVYLDLIALYVFLIPGNMHDYETLLLRWLRVTLLA